MKYLRSRRNQGATLIAVLAFILIFSIVLAGLSSLAVSHTSLSKIQSEYAAAIHLADAGINYELMHISRGLPAPAAHGSGSKYSGSITNVTGTFQCWVTANADGTGTWAGPPSNSFWVWGTGTVSGVARTVKAQGTSHGLFEDFSVFGINSVSFNGQNSEVGGNLGTNGTVSSPSSGSGAVSGEITLYGQSATGPTGSNVYREPDPIIWPTVDQIVAATFTGGWNWLTSNSPMNRSNAQIRVLTSSVNDPINNISPSNTQVTNQWATSVQIRTNDFAGQNAPIDGVVILPPGDYYFTDISMSGSNRLLIADTAGRTTGTPGMVRIWMSNSTSADTITMGVTSADSTKFRLYYDKFANNNDNLSLTITGTTTFNGSIYSVQAPGNHYAQINVGGGSVINGSVIGNRVDISGNSQINFPAAGNGNPNDFPLWYGFKNQWQEVAPSGGVTFVDGTNK